MGKSNKMKFLENFPIRNLFLISALVLGLSVSEYASFLKGSMLYILTFMMTLSLQSISSSIFKPNRLLIKPILWSIFFNYFLFGIILLLLAYVIIPFEHEMFAGFVLIAISPPGIVIVPFAARMKSNVDWSAIGVIGSYFFLLILFPITMIFFNAEINPYEIFMLLLFSVILPLVFSRILRKLPSFKFTTKHQGLLIDISFFVLIYVVIGINKNLLVNNFHLAAFPLLVFMILLFPITALFIHLLKTLKLPQKDIINKTLMFSVKNNGFSAVTAITLFGTVAAIPSAALSVVLLIYLIAFPAIIKLSSLKK